MSNKLFAIVFLMTAAAFICSAQTPEQAIQEARDRFSDIKNRSFELERSKRESQKRPAENYSVSILPKIKEDFEQIQKININLLQPSFAKSPFDSDDVLKAVAEINQRANHLKSALFPNESEEKKKFQNEISSPTFQDIKPLSASLDKAISDFVHNRIFQNTQVVDAQDSVKAQRDLNAIIDISLLIKKKLKNLIKSDSEK